MRYWLMKSEPDQFSIHDLKHRPHQTEHWDGVRNYQARNFMRDDMKKGDQIFFYHSSCAQPGIYGIAEVCREAYPDFTAFDPTTPYYDPKSTPEAPRWFMVDVRFKTLWEKPVLLSELKQQPALKDMQLIKRGRLSVQPVTQAAWDIICQLARPT